MTQVADGILCETEWEGGNVGAKSTSDGIVLVDSPMFSRDARTWKERGCDRDEVEERVDLFSYFPVEKGKEERTRNFIRLGVGRMFSQLVESQDKKTA